MSSFSSSKRRSSKTDEFKIAPFPFACPVYKCSFVYQTLPELARHLDLHPVNEETQQLESLVKEEEHRLPKGQQEKENVFREIVCKKDFEGEDDVIIVDVDDMESIPVEATMGAGLLAEDVDISELLGTTGDDFFDWAMNVCAEKSQSSEDIGEEAEKQVQEEKPREEKEPVLVDEESQGKSYVPVHKLDASMVSHISEKSHEIDVEGIDEEVAEVKEEKPKEDKEAMKMNVDEENDRKRDLQEKTLDSEVGPCPAKEARVVESEEVVEEEPKEEKEAMSADEESPQKTKENGAKVTDDQKAKMDPEIRKRMRNVARHLFVCLVKNCPASFKNFNGLEEHVKKNHKIIPTDAISCCAVCEKTFASFDEAMEHIGAREGLQCCRCKKFLTATCYLVRHHRSHTGEKPHECKECGTGFAKRIQLIYHISCHLNKKPTDSDGEKVPGTNPPPTN